ncbi:MAG: PIN domain-containing protein [Terriglobales bacterium]
MKQHIALDSNAIIPSYGMRGSRISALFDFARRTESELILFESVRHEILANHKRTLVSCAKEARSAWRELQQTLESPSSFDQPDINHELDAMAHRLQDPQTGVRFKTPHIVVDSTEVARRGAYRVKPASEDGEELRDVIVWLSFLEYVKEGEWEYVFISADKGFWSKTGLHEQIEDDIRIAGKRITMYRSIEDFLKAQDIPAKPLTESDALALLRNSEFDERMLRAVSAVVTADWKNHTADEGRIESLNVKSATIYEISLDHRLVEATFEIVVVYTASMKSGTSIFSSSINFRERIYPTNFEEWPMSTPISFSPYEPMLFGFAVGIRVRGTLSVSARLQNGVLDRLDLDGFTVESVDEIRKSSD